MLTRREFIKGLLALGAASVLPKGGILRPERRIFDMAANTWRLVSVKFQSPIEFSQELADDWVVADGWAFEDLSGNGNHLVANRIVTVPEPVTFERWEAGNGWIFDPPLEFDGTFHLTVDTERLVTIIQTDMEHIVYEGVAPHFPDPPYTVTIMERGAPGEMRLLENRIVSAPAIDSLGGCTVPPDIASAVREAVEMGKPITGHPKLLSTWGDKEPTLEEVAQLRGIDKQLIRQADG